MEDDDENYDPRYFSGLEFWERETGMEDLSQRYVEHQVFIMYHGTTMANALKIQLEGFVPSTDGMLGRGVYLSRDIKKASAYPKNAGAESRAVIQVKVQVGLVRKIWYQGHPLQKTWHMHGYDTAWVPPKCGMVPSGLEEDCVYDPRRIEVLQIFQNE
ncbi:hypothetical protein Baya_10429 [Bagarius yarrelli]|uniref:PARP catalytic domain-containing protein n=1 Tax=Bagarius yarrelli TaxID=175774 RepID=A0A556UF71_BAGYA|nr:hypothetical protein Baya_10429 [Bagarius yarrelli]